MPVSLSGLQYMYWDPVSAPVSPDQNADCLILQLLVSKEPSMEEQKQLHAGKYTIKQNSERGNQLLQVYFFLQL